VAGAEDEDVKRLQELYDLMREEGLESLELQDDQFRVRLQRGRRGDAAKRPGHHDTAPSHPSVAPTEPSEALSNAQVIATPLAGVFYRSSSPTSAPYAQEGAVVEPGQTLCIVEAMKVMNEIKAEARCRIVKILAENSRPVAAGQALFQVEPA
jgi:acetyl-CoA carboxylase biotin carboxyl carrier protein